MIGAAGAGKTKLGAGTRAAMLSLDDAVAARRIRYLPSDLSSSPASHLSSASGFSSVYCRMRKSPFAATPTASSS